MLEKARVAVLISGRGSNMAALIYAAKAGDCPFEIVLVGSDKPAAPGIALARAEGVEVAGLDAKALGAGFWDALQAELDRVQADTVALAGFMRIIPADFVARWDGRMVNIHPSLLPRHKGLNTHEAVILAGEERTGATVHLVVPEVDSGEILGQVEVAVMPGDSAEALSERVLIAEHQLYPRVLAEFVSREASLDWIIGKVGGLALALPETHAKTSHGSPGWRVGSESAGKFFAIMFNRHHGEDSIGVLVKCSGQDEMAQLIEASPDIYFRPAYYGPSDWIGIRLDRRGVDWGHVAERLSKSWRIVAPPRLTKLLRAADEF